MIGKLFVYGTLQLPEVTEKILGQRFPAQAAQLRGYRCGLIERADFPGILPSSNSVVEGQLLSGLTAGQLVKLDQYEGELYQRIKVAVAVGSESCTAWVYCIAPWARHRVSSTLWTVDWYRSRSPKCRLTYQT